MKGDTSKECFRSIWPDGYVESWKDTDPKWEQRVWEAGIKPFASPHKEVLEIGCGGGLWTLKYLCPNFSRVIALDLLPREKAPQADNLHYFELPDQDFTCGSVIDSSIDFVFSYNTFPHLSGWAQREYLASIYRVMKPGADAVIHFANADRHPLLLKAIGVNDPEFRLDDKGSWFYNDMSLTLDWVKEAGFIKPVDLIPNDYRDTLLWFQKPC